MSFQKTPREPPFKTILDPTFGNDNPLLNVVANGHPISANPVTSSRNSSAASNVSSMAPASTQAAVPSAPLASFPGSATNLPAPVPNGPASAISSTEDFFSARSSTQDLSSALPASYRRLRDEDIHIPRLDEHFLKSQLDIGRLEEVHSSFWMVGRPMPPRPLHYQRILSRAIYIHENMDMHLVWGGGRLFLKPIPRFLLDPRLWRDHLQCKTNTCPETASRGEAEKTTFCENCRWWRCALGYLLSYACLIANESDFRIAKEHHLIPHNTEWQSWKTFVRDLLSDEHIHSHINPRFIYGELRLSRLNKIYRFKKLRLLRGYTASYNVYADFFHDNFAALASGTVYVALVLTAMQVGLGTKQLVDSPRFNAVSYGFTVFSIVGPLAVTGIILCVFVVYLVNNLVTTLRFEKKRFKQLDEKKPASA